MNRLLTARRLSLAAFVLCLAVSATAHAKNIYVAKNGNNANSGTSSSPYLTIQKGMNVAKSGDTVLVRNGTYYEQVTFKSNGVTLKAVNKHGAKIVSNNRYAVFTNGKNWLSIINLDIKNTFDEWYDSTGVAVIDSHNVKVIGNKIHDCGGNAIGVKFSDALTIEWNQVWNNSKTNQYQTSGISIYQPQRLHGGDWNTKIRYNKSWNNSHTVVNPYTGTISDGNGIIIDNTKGVDQSDDFGVPGSDVVYNKWILVDSNMCWNNGGAGITTYEATKVMIRNNSTRNNFRVLDTGAAEIVVGSSENVRVINNAMHGRGNKPVTKEYWSSNIQWSHNAIHNGYNENATLWNTLWVNPKFVSSSNLHLQSTSPCVNRGTNSWGLNDKDIDNQARVRGGTVDIGADER